MIEAGVDEVGRGPLAGPVVSAAVILDNSIEIEGLNDSKKLTEKKRQELSKKIKESAIAWSLASASIEEIDSINIFLRGGLFKGWVILKASLGDLRSKLYSSGSVIEETSNKAGLLQLRIEIGNDELLELESIEGFEVLGKEQINIKEAV